MAANASAQLAGIASQLATVGKTWRLEAARTLRDTATSKIVPALKASALQNLPHSGGLNEHVASQPITASVGLSLSSSYVRLRQPYFDASQTNQGYVRHPTFGRRAAGQWSSTSYQPMTDWWTDPLEKSQDEVTAALVQDMVEIGEAVDRAGAL